MTAVRVDDVVRTNHRTPEVVHEVSEDEPVPASRRAEDDARARDVLSSLTGAWTICTGGGSAGPWRHACLQRRGVIDDDADNRILAAPLVLFALALSRSVHAARDQGRTARAGLGHRCGRRGDPDHQQRRRVLRRAAAGRPQRPCRLRRRGGAGLDRFRLGWITFWVGRPRRRTGRRRDGPRPAPRTARTARGPGRASQSAHFGARLSRNAAMPSWASGVCEDDAMTSTA